MFKLYKKTVSLFIVMMLIFNCGIFNIATYAAAGDTPVISNYKNGGEVVKNTTVDFTITDSDGVQAIYYWWNYPTQQTGTQGISVPTPYPSSYVAQIPVPSQTGLNILDIQVIDTQGKIKSMRLPYYVVNVLSGNVDKTVPAFDYSNTAEWPVSNTSLERGKQKITITATDTQTGVYGIAYVWKKTLTPYPATSEYKMTYFSYPTDKTAKVTTTAPMDAGAGYLFYYAIDGSMNATSPWYRNYNVETQNVPEVTLKGQASVVVPLGGNYQDEGATATDKYDSSFPKTIYGTGTVNYNQVGTYTLTYKVQDTIGNWSNTVTRTIKVVDNSVPTVTATYSPSENTNGNVTVTLNSNKELKAISGWTEVSTTKYTKTYTENKQETITVEDLLGNKGTATINVKNIDKLAPNTFNLSYTVTTNSITVTGSTADAPATSQYAAAGIAKYQYKIDNGAWQDSNIFTNLTQGSNHTVSMKAIDKVGNEREATNKNTSVTLKTISSEITMNASTTNWTKEDVTVSVIWPSDVAGLTKQYSLDGTTWNTYTNSFKASANGTIYARLIDNNNQTSEATAALSIENIDKTMPNAFNLNYSVTTNTIKITGATIDDISGIEKYQYKLDNGAWQDSNTFTNLAQGSTHTVSMKAIDKAGNEREVSNKDVSVTLEAISSAGITIVPSINTITKEDVTVSITWPNDISAFTKQYSTNGTIWNTYEESFAVSTNCTIYARLIDNNNQASDVITFSVSNIDKALPSAFDLSYTATTNSITVTGTTIDEVANNQNASSGIAKYQYRINDGEWQDSNNFTNLTQGETYTVSMKAIDKVGNEREATNKNVSVTLKTIPSEITIKTNVEDWTKEDVTVSITWPNDITDLTKQYSLDGTTWNTYVEEFTISDNCIVYARLADSTNQTSPNTAWLIVANIDKVAPEHFNLDYEVTTESITVTGSTTDILSGIEKYQYKLDNGEWQDSNNFTNLAPGSIHTISMKAIDKAGNEKEVENKDLSVTVNNYVTEIEVTTPADKITYIEGQSFDREGMVVTLTYADGTTNVTTNYSIDVEEPLTVGTKTVTVTYKGTDIIGDTPETSFEIEVEAKKVTKIEVKAEPKTNYIVGETLDLTGTAIVISYNNGTTKEVDYENFETENLVTLPAQGTVLTDADTEITITYSGTDTIQDAVTIAKIELDITNYNKLADRVSEIEAESLVETDYSVSTWLALDAALTEANAILDEKTATQEEIDIALENLNTARTNLSVDYTVLEARVSEIEAEGLVETDYSISTWLALDVALTGANTIVDEKTAKQSEVNIVLTALNIARSGLEFANAQRLEDAKIAAGLLNENDYTTSSWSDLQNALAMVEATNSEMGLKADAIEMAIYALDSEFVTGITLEGEPETATYGDSELDFSGITITKVMKDTTKNESIDISEVDVSGYDASKIGIQEITIKYTGKGQTGTEDFEAKFTITVGKKALTVTAENKSKTYGELNPELTVSYSGFVLGEDKNVLGGELEITTDATVTSPIGEYEIVASGLTSNNYDITFEKGTLTVEERTLKVKIGNQSSEYGSEIALDQTAYEIEEGNIVNEDDLGIVLSTEAIQTSNAGTYEITGASSNNNYNVEFTNGTLTINKKDLTVTVEDKSKIYGEINPEFTATYSGFVLGEDETVLSGDLLITTDATVTSPVGEYEIVASGLTSNNYNITFVNATLTVGERTLKVKIGDQSSEYGSEIALTQTAYEIEEGNIVNEDDLGVVLSTAAIQTSNAGTYEITGTSSNSNYVVEFTNGTLTINKKALTVTANDKSKVYGEENPELTVSYDGFVLDEDKTVLSGELEVITDATVTSPVGTYEIVASGLTSNNYNITFVNGTLTVSEKAIQVTIGNQSSEYGSEIELDQTAYEVEEGSLVNEDDLGIVLSTEAIQTSNAGTYEITGTSSNSNYIVEFTNGTLTVNKKGLTVTVEDKSKIYGELNPELTATYSGFVLDEDKNALSGTLSIATDGAEISPVGEYEIVASGLTSENYEISYVDGTLTVNKKDLTVTADDKIKQYGEVNPELTVSYDGFVLSEDKNALGGELEITTAATVTSPVGEYDIVASGLTSNNYEITFEQGTLTIGKKALTVTADDKGKIYGEENPELTVSYEGFIPGDDEAVLEGDLLITTDATVTSQVGTYEIVASGLTSNNYDITFANGTLTVNKKDLTVTADDKNKVYGEENPELTASYEGFVLDEEENVLDGMLLITTDAAVTSLAGTYEIVVSGLTSNNYNITFANGTLTVGKKALTVTADDKNKVYGEENPELTATYSGFVLGEDKNALGGELEITTEVAEASPVGTYEIIASGLTSENYEISYVDGTLTVNKKGLIVSADDKIRKYGETNPEFGVKYNGFVLGEDKNVLGGELEITTAATVTSPVGEYEIVASGVTSENYEITFVSGTLTIGKKALTVTADDKGKVYGELNPELTVSYEGFIPGDDETVLEGDLLITTAANQSSIVGEYEIAVSGVTADNYEITFVEGTLTVNKKGLIVTVEDKSKIYGEENPELTVNYDGFVLGEDKNVLGGDLLITTDATVTSPVGEYEIVASGLTSNNYEITFEKGTLVVGKKALTVTADDKGKAYGEENPELTVSYDGFVLGEDKAVLSGDLLITTDATITSPVGEYEIVASGLTSENYEITFVSGTLTVGEKSIQVTIGNQSSEYGSEIALDQTAYEVEEGSIVNEDDLGVVLSTEAVQTSNAGTYEITGTSSNSNYVVEFTKGTLTINKKELAVTAENKSKIYGEENPEFGVSYDGFVLGEDETKLSGDLLITTDATVTSPVGTYNIVASGLTSNNYNITFVNGRLTVVEKAIQVTIGNQSSEYGSEIALDQTAYEIEEGSLVGEDDLGIVLSTEAVQTSNAGTYEITGESSNSNYVVEFTNGTLTINKKDLIVTAEDKSKTYGELNPELTVSYSRFVLDEDETVLSGELEITTAANQSSIVGEYEIVASGLTSNNYNITFEKGTLTVGERTLKVKIGNQSSEYGSEIALNQATYEIEEGSLVGEDDLGIVLSTEAVQTSNSGTYEITGTSSNSNYIVEFTNGTLTINKKDLTVMLDNKSKTYGELNPEFTATYSGFVLGEDETILSGDLLITTDGAETSPVGEYEIVASGLTSNNYEISYVDGTLTVNKKSLIVSADDKIRKYGETNPEFTLNYDGFVLGEDVAVLGGDLVITTDATITSPVGEYEIVASGLTSSNYEISYVDGTLTVGKKALTVTADNKSKIYGEENPELTVSYEGFIPGDDETVFEGDLLITTVANQSSIVDEYEIEASGVTAENYEITFVKGTLTVNKKGLIVTVEDKSKTYGDLNPEFTVTYEGFVLEENENALGGELEITTDGAEASPVGTYNIVASGLTSSNYEISYVNGTLTIGKKALTVTADDKGKVYGEENPELTVNYNGFVLGEDETVLSGDLLITTDATVTSSVGEYEIVASGLTSNNYEITFVSGRLTVGEKTIQVTIGNQSSEYGSEIELDQTAYEVEEGSLVGEDDLGIVLSTGAIETSNAGTYEITGTSSNNNYDVEFTNGTLTINKKALTVTAENKNKTYGELNPELTASYDGFVLGEGETVLSGDLLITTNATEASPVGTYEIVASGLTSNNYEITFEKGILTIGERTLKVKIGNQSSEYGSEITLDQTAYEVEEGSLVDEDDLGIVLSTGAIQTSNAGTYEITGTSTNSNYDVEFINGTLTINKKALTVTAENKNKMYGELNPEFTATYGGFVLGEDETVLSGDLLITTDGAVTSPVGTYEIVASGLTSNNYNITFENGTLTVSEKAIQVTIGNQSSEYGSEIELDQTAYEVEEGSLVDEDDLGIVLSTGAIQTSNAGTYEITGTSTNSNYDVEFINGTLTINKKALTVTADDKSKTYGEENPELTVSYDGFISGDDETVLEGELLKTTAANQSSIVDEYEIEVSGVTADNYNITFENGTLTINKKDLIVSADDKIRKYGEENPELTVSYNGFVLNEDKNVLGGNLLITTDGAETSPIGTYEIVASGLTSNNYEIIFENGTLIIGKKALTVTAENKSKTYGEENPELTVSYEGFIPGDDESVLEGSLLVTTEATETSPVDEYEIVASGLTSENYEITFEKGTLTINKKGLIVTADDKSKTYGDLNPEFTVTYGGFVLDEDETVLGGELEITTDGAEASPVGTYNIAASGLTSSNYEISYVDGALTVGKKALTVTADNQSKVYGEENPEFTATYSGFVLDEDETKLSGELEITTDATMASPIGEYEIVASGLTSNNYEITFENGTLTVSEKAIQVTIGNQSSEYGSEIALDQTAYEIEEGSLVGEDDLGIVLSTEAIQTSNVGTYEITGTSANSNYDVEFTNGTLTVNKKALTVTADDKNKVYGEENPEFTATYSGFVLDEDEAKLSGELEITTDATMASPIGEYEIVASGLTSNNYNITFVSGRLTVGEKTVQVTIENQSSEYGSEIALDQTAYEIEEEGLVGEDDLGIVLSTVAIQTSDAGTYEITGTSANSNYDVEFTNGTLTINKKALTVTLDNKSKVYGEENPELTASYDGFVLGEDAAVLSGELEITTDATVASPVGEYEIVATGVTSNNYEITFEKGTLAVGKKALTVTADDQSKAYGEVNPELTVSYDGFVLGEDKAVLSGELEITTDGAVASPVGTYNIIANGLTSNNYDITFEIGTLTVGEKAIQVTIGNQSSEYGNEITLDQAAYEVEEGSIVGEDDLGIVLSTEAAQTSDAGTYEITGTSVNSNYDVEFTNGTLTISKKGLTVTVEDKSKIYGEENPEFTATYSGFVLDEDEAKLSGDLLITTDGAATSPVGTYNIVASGLTSDNYNITFENGTLTIDKKALTVTADDQSKAYGEVNPELTVSYEGFVLGEDKAVLIGDIEIATDAIVASPVGTYNIVASGLTSNNYNITFENGTLTVGERTLKVKIGNQSSEYGSEIALNQTVYELEEGSLVGEDDLGIVLSTEAVQTSNAGTYEITGTSSNSNYNVEFTNGTLTINKKGLIVTADDQSKVYGELNPEFTVSYDGFVLGEDAAVLSGELEITTDGAEASPAGEYEIVASGLTSNNYNITFVSGTLTVSEKSIQVTIGNQSSEYGSEIALDQTAYEIEEGSLVGEDDLGIVLSTEAVQTSNAGTYEITGTSSNNDYVVEFTKGTLTIGKKDLTVTVENKSKTYGEENPELTATYSGFVLGEDETVLSGELEITTDATVASPIGEYEIIASGLTSNNYNITFEKGILTVSEKAIQVTIGNQSSEYGSEITLDQTAYEVEEGSLIGEDDLGIVLSTGAVQTSNAGTYEITGTSSNSNYDVEFTNGTLTVNKKALTVTAEDKNKTYGELNPELTVSYSGFVLGENDEVFEGDLLVTTAANQSSIVDEYEIEVSGVTADNYEITFVSGTLTVGKKALTVTAEDKSKGYGEVNPELTVNYDGFVLGEDETKLNGTLSITTNGAETSPIGEYEIVASGLTSNNYNITFVNGRLTVREKAIQVTIENQSSEYGSEIELNQTAYEIEEGSLIGEDDLGIVLSTEAVQTSNAGTYEITGESSNNNYVVEFTNGTLAINKKDLTVTAEDKSKTYGEANPTFTVIYDGFILGENEEVLEGDLLITTDATVTSPVGIYEIVASGLTSNNYNITFENGTLTVGEKVIQVTIGNQSSEYGSEIELDQTAYEIEEENLVGENDLGIVLSTEAVQTSNAGTYEITGTSSNSDYVVEFTKGTLTINKKALTVTVDNKSKTYGELNPEFTVTYSGFVLDEDEAKLNGELEITTDGAETSPVGTYEIVASGLTSNNYEISYVDGTLTVNQASGELNPEYEIPSDLSKIYEAGITLAYIDLPEGWSWVNRNELLSVPGGSYKANYTSTNSNYADVANVDIAIVITKADGTTNPAYSVPANIKEVYEENMTLANITLPTGWAWVDDSIEVVVPEGTYKASYTSADNNYADVSNIDIKVEITINVDFTELDSYLESINYENLISTDYSNWAQFEALVNEAYESRAQSTLNNKLAEIKDEGLIAKTVNQKRLDDYMNAVNKLVPEDYSNWTEFNDEIVKVRAINTLQSEFDAAYAELINFNLAAKPIDETKLNEAKAELAELNEEEYAVASWKAVTDKIAEAEGQLLQSKFNAKVDEVNILISNLVERELSGIEVSQTPKTTYNVNEELDLSAGKINLLYNNGTKSEISMQDTNVTLSGYDETVSGAQDITVSYSGFTAMFRVVVIDETKPVITLVGDKSITLVKGIDVVYNDLGATAVDTNGNDITSSIITTNPVNVNAAGTYTVTYSVTSLANGNPADEVTRTVKVIELINPVISFSSSTEKDTDSVTIAKDQKFVDGGVFVIEGTDENPEITITGAVDNTKPGVYTLTYVATDKYGNTSNEVTRTVTVTDYPPDITYTNGAKNVMPKGNEASPFVITWSSTIGYTRAADITEVTLTKYDAAWESPETVAFTNNSVLPDGKYSLEVTANDGTSAESYFIIATAGPQLVTNIKEGQKLRAPVTIAFVNPDLIDTAMIYQLDVTGAKTGVNVNLKENGLTYSTGDLPRGKMYLLEAEDIYGKVFSVRFIQL